MVVTEYLIDCKHGDRDTAAACECGRKSEESERVQQKTYREMENEIQEGFTCVERGCLRNGHDATRKDTNKASEEVEVRWRSQPHRGFMRMRIGGGRRRKNCRSWLTTLESHVTRTFLYHPSLNRRGSPAIVISVTRYYCYSFSDANH